MNSADRSVGSDGVATSGNVEERVEELLLDWGFAELRGESAPDLAANVRARWAVRDLPQIAAEDDVFAAAAPSAAAPSAAAPSAAAPSAAAPSAAAPSAAAFAAAPLAEVDRPLRMRARAQRRPRPSGSRWLAAATLLLGIGVVVAVAATRGEHERDRRHAAAPFQEPRPVPVGPETDVALLPADTRAVEAHDVDDATIAALTRLRDLEVLIVREPANESFGLGLKRTPPNPVRHVTAASWPHFVRFTKLRRLELSGTVRVADFWSVPEGERTAAVAAALDGLDRLPLLEHVALRFLDAPDELLQFLPRLRYLRSADLSFDHGFGAEGVAALARCTALRSLSLRGCQQLHGESLLALGTLSELERLDVSLLDGTNWRAGTADFRAPGAPERTTASGVTDEALRGIAKAPRLRELDVSGGRFSRAGLAELGACATLRDLSARGGRGGVPLLANVPHLNALFERADDAGAGDRGWVASLPDGLERLAVGGAHDDAFCRAVREHLPALCHLELAGSDRVTDAGVAELVAMPSLRSLDLRQMRGLTAASIEHLAAARQLEWLDLRHNSFVTEPHVERLRAALPNLRELLANPD